MRPSEWSEMGYDLFSAVCFMRCAVGKLGKSALYRSSASPMNDGHDCLTDNDTVFQRRTNAKNGVKVPELIPEST